jgi:DNA-binding response OmpR family regulator
MVRVLIVEDTPAFRGPVAAVLRKHGYQVSEAGNGLEALESLKFNTPQIILLDLSMPQMDGLTFLKKLRTATEFTDLPVILLTALADRQTVLKAKELGISDYLIKSAFSLEEILEKVAKALKSRTEKQLSELSSFGTVKQNVSEQADTVNLAPATVKK